MYTYEYPHPAVTTDCVIFGFDGKDLHILLIERGIEPYKGLWALPGGFLKLDETAEDGARRELMEETSIQNVYLEQFHTFTTVDRDPRERVLTIAYYALIHKSDYQVIAGDDAAKAAWFAINELPPLAFDHKDIFMMARERLKERLAITPIAFKLLDEKFKMSELQRLYEIINGTSYDRRNFQKKMVSTGLLSDEGPNPLPEQNRTATLYSFREDEFKKQNESHKWKKYPFDF
ncbi:NUDIX hydrolase [Alloprevotella tannerae]|uniref:NUDIX hydrolase n=1 Tax=Alloprevotella tannerae TaxID=76122 RepID=UPI0028EF7E54|nr:NUDIX domain-containing protein [Alloprevotella tannerae]